ncbi:hypothetical protein [Brevibacillus sp. DP1.3A]|uniref:hypothetical protein n=1 Tax=Brevibacillus sp. DP1.3A TaxID=2738867 RepID=UPI001D16F2E3|nr:hypothetical protein [Brevibacillus sp. DP1.3A]UED73960.1 hypothetical protein HP399_025020 [Brevibacillus sp. DP1.3A]
MSTLRGALHFEEGVFFFLPINDSLYRDLVFDIMKLIVLREEKNPVRLKSVPVALEN